MMRRSLLFLLAGLLAAMAQPAMANRMVVRGNVAHHHHVFFRHNQVFFHHHNRIFFSSATNPFFFSPTFTLASPFIAQPLPFGTWSGGWGSRAFGGFGAPVALGGGGFADSGGGTVEPRVIVVAMPAANAPPRRPEEARPTVEETPSGVTIIRGPGSQHY
jgi:hypothetical protein